MNMIKIKVESKRKLVEKGIKWEEHYTDKTVFWKTQFEDIIGKGCYFRFEGEDPHTGDEYYCIIGPAKIHKPIAKFFAGVRKLPATYSAGGKYFDSMDKAANYARDTWGVDIPDTLKPYTSAHLYGIGKRVEEWREQHKDDALAAQEKED